MKLSISTFILMLLSSLSAAESRLSEIDEYKKVLKEYTKIILTESCFSQGGGCSGENKEWLVDIQFDQAEIGEYEHKKNTYYYVVMPIKSGGSATVMFSRKSLGDKLNYCGLMEAVVSFEDQKSNIKLVEYNICLM